MLFKIKDTLRQIIGEFALAVARRMYRNVPGAFKLTASYSSEGRVTHIHAEHA